MTELFRLLGTIAIENESANDAIDETTSKAEQSENKMVSAFKKVGGAIATYFAVDKIVDFGKACVESSASVKAMNAQFEQTFAELSKDAEDAIGRVASSSNILDTRLQGVGTSIFAFAKTAGMESTEALGMMERALQVTADSASYYDRSLEETSESLKSFLKGNFENDSALGLSCTETTRNTKANELYGKSFKDLSEAQKQLTLLAMVEDANKLSGALGQASREGEGWENVTGNMKESWKQFQAVIGAPILNALVPVVQKLTKGISGLGEKVSDVIDFMSDGQNRVDLFRNALESVFSSEFIDSMEEWFFYLSDIVKLFASNTIERFSSKLENIKTMFSSVANVIRPLIETYLNGLVQGFDTLLVIWNDAFVPAISFIVDAFTQLVTIIADAVAPSIEAIGEKFQELQEFVSATVQNYILPVITSFIEMIQQLWIENQDKITLIGELFTTVFQTIAGLVSWFVDTFKNYIYPLFGWFAQMVTSNMDNIKAIFQSAFDIIGGIVQFFIALFQGDWSGMWEAIKTILQSGFEFIKNTFELIKTFLSSIGSAIWSVVSNAFENVKTAISTKLNSAKTTVTNIFNSIKKAISDAMDSAKKVVSDAVEKLKSLFNFEWKLPKIKLPHFSITGEFSINPPSMPSIGVEWYKDGGILTEPTAFGINPSSGKMMVGGEAGHEAILPVDNLKTYVAEAVAEQNEGLIFVLKQILQAILDADENIVEGLNGLFNEMEFKVNKREFARLVKAVG